MDELEKLAVKSPNRYRRGNDGNWRCPPGEQYASEAGLYYRIRCSAEIDWILQRNIQFLEDYLRVDSASANAFADHSIRDFVRAHPGILLCDLLEQTEKRDEIYLLIATGEIYTDLRAAAIAESDRVRLFASAETAAAHQLVYGGGETAGQRIHAAVHHTEAFRLLAGASEQDLRIANRRLDHVRRHLEGETTPQEVPARTMRFWIARYRFASARYGSGYVGLLPRTAQRGNRND